LADSRVDPSMLGNIVIGLASERGRTEIVKLLLADKRVDSSASNNIAIQIANENGHTETVKLLLSDERCTLSQEERAKYIS